MLVLEVRYSFLINTSRFKWLLKPGIYLYFGSAQGTTSTSLEKRLTRHFKKKSQKKIFWHIDYLTSYSDTRIIIAYYNIKTEITECLALQDFVQKNQTEIIPNFGSTDCKSKCGGHLLFFSSDCKVLADLDNYLILKNWCVFTPTS